MDIRRQATDAEVKRLQGWLRWAYDHGRLLVVWDHDNCITLKPAHDQHKDRWLAILDKGAGNGGSVGDV